MTGRLPLEILVEVGVEKLRRDYVHLIVCEYIKSIATHISLLILHFWDIWDSWFDKLISCSLSYTRLCLITCTRSKESNLFICDCDSTFNVKCLCCVTYKNGIGFLIISFLYSFRGKNQMSEWNYYRSIASILWLEKRCIATLKAGPIALELSHMLGLSCSVKLAYRQKEILSQIHCKISWCHPCKLLENHHLLLRR